jgi:hypothetical protein
MTTPSRDMQTHADYSDEEFEQLFQECRLDPKLFSHEAHLRLAWIHVRKYGMERAIESICGQLQRYVQEIGAQSKYHHTLTIAAIKVVAHFMRRSTSTSFNAFIVEHSRLKFNFKELIGSHYRIDIFNCDKARHQFMEPDFEPFD